MPKHKLDIVFEDERIIALNKPSGLLSIPDREGKDISLKRLLKEKYEEIYVVHRIDKDTSGLIVFAKDEETHKQLSQLFEERVIEKYYVGLVYGGFEQTTGHIDAPIAEHPHKNKMLVHHTGKPSQTDYEVIESFKLLSWVKFRIHTGRTHQIRVHMQHINHSIVCDGLYGNADPIYISSLKHNYKLSKKEESEKPVLSRLALHSWQLKFELKGKTYTLEADIPKDLKALLQQLRKRNNKPI